MQPSSNDLNLTQVRDALGKLAQYRHQQTDEVITSPHGIVLTPATTVDRTISELNKFAKDPSEEWSAKLSSLNNIVRKIEVFLAENPDADAIDENEVQEAVAGLSCILDNKIRNSKEHDAPAFLEKAVLDLAMVCMKLHRQREEKAQALFSKASSQGEKATPVTTQVVWKYFNPFTYFSRYYYLEPGLKESQSLPKFQAKVEKPGLPKSASTPMLTSQQLPSCSLVVQPFDAKKAAVLNQLYKHHEVPLDACKAEIRAYYKDKSLTTLEDANSGDRQFKIPRMLKADLPRGELIFNGETLFSTRKKGAFDASLSSDEKAALTCIILIDALGPNCFQNLGIMLNQGALGNIIVDINLNQKPREWMDSESPYFGVFTRDVSPMSYEIEVLENQDVSIKLRIMLGVQDAKAESPGPGLSVLRGFRAYERHLIIPKAELDDPNLVNKPLNEVLPSMKARVAISKICLTPEEADKDLNAESKSLLSLFTWNYWSGHSEKKPL